MIASARPFIFSRSFGLFKASLTSSAIDMFFSRGATLLAMAVGIHEGSANPEVVCLILMSSKLSACRCCSKELLRITNADEDPELLLAACPPKARVALSSSLIRLSTVEDIAPTADAASISLVLLEHLSSSTAVEVEACEGGWGRGV